MQIDVLNIKGQSTGRQVELPAEFFGVEPNDHLIYLAVKQYLATQRQGTSKVKTRAEVPGASYSALSHKAKASSIIVVEDINMDSPKTKEFSEIMKNLNLSNTKTLFLLGDYNDNVFLSTRNIPRVKTNVFHSANTYDVMNATTLLITENVVKQFAETEEEA
jgi:large subunit ribosomal protein L4